MNIAIIGPGAVGSLLAAYLTEGGLDVTLLDHRPERAQRLSNQGIRVEGVRGTRTVLVPVSSQPTEVGSVALVIVCVKAFQTEQAIRMHLPIVGEQTAIWSVQNGLGNTEVIASQAGKQRVLGGTTTLGANLIAEGHVHHAGEGDTFIGELDGSITQRVQDLAGELSRAGIRVEVRADIERLIWNKLLVNVGINALTALLRIPNGELLRHQSTLRIMESAVREAVSVAAAHNVRFDEAAVQARVKEVARQTAANRSSMLADVLANRQTEIDFINGAIARLGPAPLNRTLTELVKGIHP